MLLIMYWGYIVTLAKISTVAVVLDLINFTFFVLLSHDLFLK